MRDPKNWAKCCRDVSWRCQPIWRSRCGYTQRSTTNWWPRSNRALSLELMITYQNSPNSSICVHTNLSKISCESSAALLHPELVTTSWCRWRNCENLSPLTLKIIEKDIRQQSESYLLYKLLFSLSSSDSHSLAVGCCCCVYVHVFKHSRFSTHSTHSEAYITFENFPVLARSRELCSAKQKHCVMELSSLPVAYDLLCCVYVRSG